MLEHRVDRWGGDACSGRPRLVWFEFLCSWPHGLAGWKGTGDAKSRVVVSSDVACGVLAES
jgi:hypothetical protein